MADGTTEGNPGYTSLYKLDQSHFFTGFRATSTLPYSC